MLIVLVLANLMASPGGGVDLGSPVWWFFGVCFGAYVGYFVMRLVGDI